MSSPPPEVDGVTFMTNVLHFGRTLRRAGLMVGTDHLADFHRIMVAMGVERKIDVKAAGRALFTKARAEREIYDRAFDLFWRRSTTLSGPSRRLPRMQQRLAPDSPMADELTEEAELPEARVISSTPKIASPTEQLRTTDFADLTPAERRDAAAMLAAMKPKLPERPSRRPLLDRTGRRLAARAMLRRSLSTGGEALHWRWFRRATRPRPIVLILDISGSMERYSRFLLRFAHALSRSGAPLEVFVFGTRLTRITRELAARDPDTALTRVTRTVVDWSGGTKIGASLKTLNQKWVRRTVRSGAVVLLVSDGWERDDPEQLAREMATLKRSCHRLMWLDPLASRPGFEPATAGLRAAMPFIDDFVPCGNVASLESLADRLRAERFSDRGATLRWRSNPPSAGGGRGVALDIARESP